MIMRATKPIAHQLSPYGDVGAFLLDAYGLKFSQSGCRCANQFAKLEATSLAPLIRPSAALVDGDTAA